MSESVEAEWIIESGDKVLRLVLFRAGDRYAHRIEFRDPQGAFATLIESAEDRLEGSENAETERWPASPPFQQFHDQLIDGGRAWFLVGMAGKSHWSASVTASPDGGSWEFDVACRFREVPTSLGSTYRLRAPIGDTLPSFGFRSLSADQPPDEWWWHGDWFGFAPKLGALAEPPASARWRYECGFFADPL